ncbi:MAG: 30S ribosomal protein S20 [Candidatus Doudnabacteria bacterium]|nr:30S ribosomal protein S20 [Candidatus Doudnabacteria bacterium]
MANTKSAIKAARQSIRRRVVNLKTAAKYKNAVRAFRKLVAAARIEEAKTAMSQAMSALDKAVKKHVMHKNRASRLKARMAKALAKTTR